MKYIVETKKTIERASKDLKKAVISNKFGVFQMHDLKATMNETLHRKWRSIKAD